MPAHHAIDNDKKLITTTWTGEAVDNELIDALTKYQVDIRSRPEYHTYNDIVDFSTVNSFRLSTEGIVKLAQIAAKTDVLGIRTKLAIIVKKPIAYGLGRMYETYRSIIPSGLKEVHVFMKHGDALAWIENKHDS
jgi:hypothetical protein